MEKILEIIEDKLQLAFAACGYEKSFGRAVLSNRPDLCEYQCNGAMAAAKRYRQKPIDIADKVVEKLKETNVFSLCDAVMPGFINLNINPQFVADYLNQMRQSPSLGLEKQKNPRMIIVDYGGANVAKPLHVGHLRAAVIGESIKRLGLALGHKVIGDVHLGDWGLQMGLIIEELRDRKPDLPYFDESYSGEYPEEAPFTISELDEIYPAASKKSKLDTKEAEEFASRAHTATRKLQEGYPPFMAVWKHIMAVSKADLKKNYSNLQVFFDLWKGESDVQSYIPGLIQDLLDQHLAYESQGALVVDIQEPEDAKELPPCIVRKSDGAALYATSDLGTILEREKEYQPDDYIYVADKRQELHFTQVFRVAKKAGFVREGVNLRFLGFGTMNGKDGKPFKTREGGIMRLENLIEEINQAAYQKIMENRTMSEEEALKTAKVVGLAALKYGDLSNQAAKDYIFDIDRFVAFTGNTGPYILYTIVRIKSILGKYTEQGKDMENLRILPAFSEGEKALMLEIARYNAVLDNAFAELAPHKICQYIYQLSDDFNHFYQENKILTEENKEKQGSWIAMIGLAKDVLTACIQVLGFDAPERM